MLRSLALLFIAIPAAAGAEPITKSGTARHAAYSVCHSVAMVDLGEIGSDTAADCRGVVKALEGPAAFDNLSLRCLEGSTARKSGYKFTGSCKETDKDGDALYISYEGPESGPVTILGGTGKFAGITGKGEWTVADAPGNNPIDFTFTLTYRFDWRLP